MFDGVGIFGGAYQDVFTTLLMDGLIEHTDEILINP